MKVAIPTEAGSDTGGATTGRHGGRADGLHRWIRTHPGMVVLLLLPVVVFGLPQLFGWTFLDGDNFLQNLPMRVLVGRDLRHGVLPLWNPYLFSGTPLLAGFNAGAGYPATWLMAVLPIFTAWWLNLVLVYDIALVGTYLFLRRQSVGSTAATFAAATFAFAGFMTGQIVHIDLISGAAWLPWMVLAVQALIPLRPVATELRLDGRAAARRRGWMAVLAVSVGMTILSGGAEAIIDSGVLVAVYAVGRLIEAGMFRRPRRRAGLRSLAALAVGTAGGMALGAAQWLPGAVFATQSQRATTSYSFFISGSLPSRVITLMASPFLLGGNEGRPGNYAGPYNFPEVTSYMGVLALIALCSLGLRRYRTLPQARHWWVWYVILGVGLLSALGGETPFGHLMYLVPVVSDERLLSRNLLLVDFSLAVLLGWWMHLLLTDRAVATGRSPAPEPTGVSPPGRPGRKEGRAEVIVTCIPLAVMAALCLFLWVDGSRLYRLLATQVAVTSTMREHEAVLVTAGVIIAAGATAIVLARRRLTPRQLHRWLAAVLAVDLVLFNSFVIRLPTTEAKALAIGPLSTALHSQVGNGRFIIYDPDELYPDQLYALGQTDLNIYSGLPSAQGYTALSSGAYFAGTGAHYQEDLNPADLTGSVWDDLNVTTLLSLPSYFVTTVGSPGRGGPDRLPRPAHEGEFRGAAGADFVRTDPRRRPPVVFRWGLHRALDLHPVVAGDPPPPEDRTDHPLGGIAVAHPGCHVGHRRGGTPDPPGDGAGAGAGGRGSGPAGRWPAGGGGCSRRRQLALGPVGSRRAPAGRRGRTPLDVHRHPRQLRRLPQQPGQGVGMGHRPGRRAGRGRQFGDGLGRHPKRLPADPGAHRRPGRAPPQRVVEHGLESHRPAVGARLIRRPLGAGPVRPGVPVRRDPEGGVARLGALPGVLHLCRLQCPAGRGPVGGGHGGPGLVGGTGDDRSPTARPCRSVRRRPLTGSQQTYRLGCSPVGVRSHRPRLGRPFLQQGGHLSGLLGQGLAALPHRPQHLDQGLGDRLFELTVGREGTGQLGRRPVGGHGQKLEQVGQARLVLGVVADVAVGVGHRPFHLAGDDVRLVEDEHGALRGLHRFGHLLVGVLEVHDPCRGAGDGRFGHHQSGTVAVVEPLGHVPGQLEVLSLVVPHGDPIGVVEQDVGALEDRVGEQPHPHRVLARTLVLELGHAPQLAHGGRAFEEPRHLGVLGHMALHEQGAALRIETGGDQVERRLEGPPPELVGGDVQREGVEVDDAVERIVEVLIGHPVADGPDIVPQVKVAAGLETGQNAGHGGHRRSAAMVHEMSLASR